MDSLRLPREGIAVGRGGVGNRTLGDGAARRRAPELLTRAGGTLPLPSDAPARLVTARWMLEELRISLFAQPLGAHGPISVQRIRTALEG